MKYIHFTKQDEKIKEALIRCRVVLANAIAGIQQEQKRMAEFEKELVALS